MERHYYEDNRDAFRGKPIAVVEDGEKALLSLAAKYRDWLNPKVVSVVGSGGKTNTKICLPKSAAWLLTPMRQRGISTTTLDSL